MDKFITVVLATLLVLGLCLISWAITVGVVWLICLCFDLTFKWAWATGIWFLMILARAVFHK